MARIAGNWLGDKRQQTSKLNKWIDGNRLIGNWQGDGWHKNLSGNWFGNGWQQTSR
jgi:hypothetical protein